MVSQWGDRSEGGAEVDDLWYDFEIGSHFDFPSDSTWEIRIDTEVLSPFTCHEDWSAKHVVKEDWFPCVSSWLILCDETVSLYVCVCVCFEWGKETNLNQMRYYIVLAGVDM